MRIKICGITCLEDAEASVDAGADVLGLNAISSSPRFIDVETMRCIVRHLAGHEVVTVLVVANLAVPAMRELLEQTGAHSLQLHGDEPPETVATLLPRAYKAIRVADEADITLADRYPGEQLLVDAKVAGQLGGTGRSVDWDLVAPLAKRRRLTLAGGLQPDNVARAIERVRPYCVDAASGVEVPGQPRRKDPARLKAFILAARRAASIG